MPKTSPRLLAAKVAHAVTSLTGKKKKAPPTPPEAAQKSKRKRPITLLDRGTHVYHADHDWVVDAILHAHSDDPQYMLRRLDEPSTTLKVQWSEPDLEVRLPHKGLLRSPKIKTPAELVKLGRKAVSVGFPDDRRANMWEWNEKQNRPSLRNARIDCDPRCSDEGKPPASHIKKVTKETTRCGGNLLLPCIKYAAGKDVGKRAVGPLPGGGGVYLDQTVEHGTTLHHPEEERMEGCKAHVSAVMQTSVVLFSAGKAFDRTTIDRDLAICMALDVRDPNGIWYDASWVPGERTGEALSKAEQKKGQKLLDGKLRNSIVFDPDEMAYLQYQRSVVYERETGRFLLGSACDQPEYHKIADKLRVHGEPMQYMAGEGLSKDAQGNPTRLKFCSHRTRDALDDDEEQRMHYVGLKSDLRNVKSNANLDKKWSDRRVNTDDKADLALYAAPLEQPQYWLWSQQKTYEMMAAEYQKAFPRATTYKMAMLETVDTERRSHSDIGCFFSKSRLASFLGITSGFNSASHSDPRDINVAFAIAAKCGKTNATNTECGCDPRGCRACLMDPRMEKEEFRKENEALTSGERLGVLAANDPSKARHRLFGVAQRARETARCSRCE